MSHELPLIVPDTSEPIPLVTVRPMILDKAIPSREVGGTYVSGSHFLPDWRVKRGEVQSITDEIKKARDAALQELSEMKLDGKIRSNYYSTTKKDDS